MNVIFESTELNLQMNENHQTGDLMYYLTIKNPDLVRRLHDTNDSAFFAQNPRVRDQKLFPYLELLEEFYRINPTTAPMTEVDNSSLPRAERDWYFNDKPINVLMVVQHVLKREIEEIAILRKKGLITFSTMWSHLMVGREVYTMEHDTIVGGVISGIEYYNGWPKPSIKVEIDVIKKNHVFQASIKEYEIAMFQGAVPVENIAIKIMTPAIKTFLSERGKKMIEILDETPYMNYSGTMFRRSMFKKIDRFNATGRIMIDYTSMTIMDPDYFDSRDTEDDSDIVADEETFYKVYPIVHGFSFRTKKWGQFLFEKCFPIEYRTQAFDLLVLDQTIKTQVHSLVSHFKTIEGNDLIQGKGNGCIFLLYGPPGVGKTLTCESVAEFLKRPLYSISVGELGTDPDELEKRLRDVLEVAHSWNAVTLLDEADIFLEKRTGRDIHRNAMVSIFLRLLEYHEGVLFLTTNRVEELDPAFMSRISVSVEYHDLDLKGRTAVWENLLKVSKIPIREQQRSLPAPNVRDYRNPYQVLEFNDDLNLIDPVALAEPVLNGRQIKNVLKVAKALSASSGSPVTMNMLAEVIGQVLTTQRNLLTPK